MVRLVDEALVFFSKAQNRLPFLICPVRKLVVAHRKTARLIVFYEVVCSLPQLSSIIEFRDTRVALALVGKIIKVTAVG